MGSWAAGCLRGGAVAAAKKAVLGFLELFLCWRFSERMGLEKERERSEL